MSGRSSAAEATVVQETEEKPSSAATAAVPAKVEKSVVPAASEKEEAEQSPSSLTAAVETSPPRERTKTALDRAREVRERLARKQQEEDQKKVSEEQARKERLRRREEQKRSGSSSDITTVRSSERDSAAANEDVSGNEDVPEADGDSPVKLRSIADESMELEAQLSTGLESIDQPEAEEQQALKPRPIVEKTASSDALPRGSSSPLDKSRSRANEILLRAKALAAKSKASQQGSSAESGAAPTQSDESFRPKASTGKRSSLILEQARAARHGPAG